MKIFWFRVEGLKAVDGVEVEDDNVDRKGYIYGYGKDLESARRDAEMGLEYESIDFEDIDKEVERDSKEWFDEIWD